MTARDPDELGNPGPHWRGDGTLAPRRELRVERGLEAPRAFDPTLTLPPPVRPRVADLDVAGFGRRLSATVIDGIILAILLGVAGALAQLGLDADLDQTRLEERSFAVTQLVLLGYLLPGNVLGWSPGKAALGLRIVQPDGSRPGFGAGLSRMLVSLVAVSLIGYLWAVFDRRSQTWHDKASGTYVVRRPNNRPARPTRPPGEPDVQWEFPDRPGG
jgi:uncharacterized RDD family membrane protein YckC